MTSLRTLWAAAATAVVSAFIVSQGCAPPAPATTTKEDRLCVPGDSVFCRCGDQSPGTKLCRDDSQFDPCLGEDGTECVGGEIPDPQSNLPVDEVKDSGPPQKDASPNPPAPTADACPGKLKDIQAGVELSLTGDTRKASGDRKGKPGACAAGDGAKDHIYHLVPAVGGSLSVKVQGSDGLDPVVYLRSTCDDELAQVKCGPSTPQKLAQFDVNVAGGTDYFLIIDGAAPSAGKYVATLNLTPKSFCGDGIVDENEACDDVNKVEDDGCSNDCKHPNGNPMSGGSCPGQSVDVWPGQTVTGTGATDVYGNAWNAPSSTSCGVATDGTNLYQDHVYSVTPHDNGTLVVTVDAPPVGTLANHMIVARHTCTAPESDKTLCANNAGVGAPETLSIPVTKDQTIFVAIDGGGGSPNKGAYTVTFKLQP